ncbi:MAG: FAD-binding protein [Anaerolineales bacterium]|nr:FAD-binding protein [Anaerolineales bacterium]
MKALDYLLADVLVVGGGVAGCRAAIEAVEYASSVILVDQGTVGVPHPAAPQGGVYAAAQPTRFDGDTWQTHAADILQAGAGLADPTLVEVLAREALRGAWELDRYGIKWHRAAKGGFEARELPGHQFPRGLHVAVETGHSLKETLASHLRSHVGVRVIEDVYISSLMQHQGRVVGAIGIDRHSGDLLVLVAGSTILASGGLGGLFNFGVGWGSGVAMAYRLGAEVISPELYAPGSLVGRSNDMPYSLGGLRVDASGQTSLAALYAAGEAAGGTFGAGLLPGDALTHAAVSGAIAGRSAALAYRAIPRIKEESVKEERMRQGGLIRRALSAKPGSQPLADFVAQFNQRFQRALGPGCAEDSLDDMRTWLDGLPANWYQQVQFARTTGASQDLTPEARIDLIRMDYLLGMAKVALQAASQRAESRGVFQRSDRPETAPHGTGRFVAKRTQGQEVLTRLLTPETEALAAVDATA